MDNQQLRNFKITVIVVLILAFVGVILYLVYSFSLMWQAMAAGITIGFLLILLFLVGILAVYLWMRTLWLKREMNKYKSEMERLKRKEQIRAQEEQQMKENDQKESEN